MVDGEVQCDGLEDHGAEGNETELDVMEESEIKEEMVEQTLAASLGKRKMKRRVKAEASGDDDKR